MENPSFGWNDIKSVVMIMKLSSSQMLSSRVPRSWLIRKFGPGCVRSWLWVIGSDNQMKVNIEEIKSDRSIEVVAKRWRLRAISQLSITHLLHFYTSFKFILFYFIFFITLYSIKQKYRNEKWKKDGGFEPSVNCQSLACCTFILFHYFSLSYVLLVNRNTD